MGLGLFLAGAGNIIGVASALVSSAIANVPVFAFIIFPLSLMLEERSRRQRVSCAAENTSHEAAEKNVARLSL